MKTKSLKNTLESAKDENVLIDGHRVNIVEVENALKDHRDVIDATVFSAPDERWGNALIALVKIGDHTTADKEMKCDLSRYVRMLVSPFAVFKKIDFGRKNPRDGVVEWILEFPVIGENVCGA